VAAKVKLCFLVLGAIMPTAGCAFAPMAWSDLSSHQGSRIALRGYLAHATGGYYQQVATLCPENGPHDPKRCIDLVREDGLPVESPLGPRSACVVVRGKFEAFDDDLVLLNSTNDVGMLKVTSVGRCKSGR
jgi:hypothetical protein